MKPTNYTDKTIVMSEITAEDKFIIPQFQRNVVWNKKKQEAFIRNVLDGEPFGIILIRDKGNKYELIDGLQRITAIKAFHEKPYEYLDPIDINIEGVEKLIRAHLTSQGLPVDEKFVEDNREEWREKIFECMKGGKENYEVMTIMNQTYGVKPENNKLINDIYSELEEYKKLDSLKITAINYTGPEENIPNVFYNLNTGGVRLSKYETYAALWFEKKFKVDDQELINIVENKYTQLQKDSDLEVDITESTLDVEGITLFEYCYALGTIIRNGGIIQKDDKKFQILFSANTKSTDPTGFELLALLLTDQVNKADKLYPMLKKVSPEFLLELKEIIKESLKDITSALKTLLVGMNESSLYSESTYLIYHMMVSYIKEYYDINPETGTITKINSDLSKRDFQKYAKYHYLYDCITDFWKNNRQVSDLENEVTELKRRQKYWHDIKIEDWEKAVQIFIDSQKAVRKAIPQKNKIFIDFLTKAKIDENPQYSNFFKNIPEDKIRALDVEHIVPKKIIEDHITDLVESNQKAYPVSAVGNLCYLTAKVNRGKGEETLFEWLRDRPEFKVSNFHECVNYPSEDDLCFLDYNNEDFREKYEKFLEKRQNHLKDEFLRLI